MITALAQDDKPRLDFLKACLTKLGLVVNQDQNAAPSLSRLHLTSAKPSDTSAIVESLRGIISIQDGEEYIKDDNDTFHLQDASTWSMSSLAKALTGDGQSSDEKRQTGEEGIIDYNAVVKTVMVHSKELPSGKETPYFNHVAFFANLEYYQSKSRLTDHTWGKNLLYGEVVTSTNTLLEKYVE